MNNLRKCFQISRKSLGVILIEFAFAIPIFLILIYYLHDLPKMRLMQRKMQFVAYEIATILQNIAEQKATTDAPCITGYDVLSAMRIAYLSIYFGNTMNSTSSSRNRFPLGHFPYVGMYYLKGNGHNQYQKLWYTLAHGGAINIYDSTPYEKWNIYCLPLNTTAATADSFHPSLTIENGERKLLIACCLYYTYAPSTFIEGQGYFADGRKTDKVSPREAFGFLFINPLGSGSRGVGFFSAVATFTPSPQAFSDTLPPK